MESYYSSDEEIAWGPLTLKEIKSDLKRPRKKPSRRHTIHRSFEDSHKMDEESLCENLNKLDISEASTTYLTPNESLQTNNHNFLEKLSQVINIPNSDLSDYASVLEDTENSSQNSNIQSSISPNQDDAQIKTVPLLLVTEPIESNVDESCVDFLKALENRKTQYDIANFHQTLVDNTCILSDEEGSEEGSLNESVESKSTNCGKTSLAKDEVIIISDDSDDSIISNSGDYLCQIERDVCIKKEINLDESSEHESNPHEHSFDKVAMDEIQQELDNISGNSEDYRFHDRVTSSEESAQYESTEYPRENLRLSNVRHNLSAIRESLSTSPVIVPEIDLAQFDDSVSKEDSFQLNDTVEEMKRAVCQGLNYSMSDDEVVEISSAKEEHNSNQDFTPYSKYNRELTPCSKEIRSYLPKPISIDKKQIRKITPKSNFKVPECRKLKPTPTKSGPSHLKNIVSPVALYIKSSPRFPLRQNVPEKELPRVVPSVSTKMANKENFPEFPEVWYKPSRKQIAASEKHIVIPPYMRKLNTKEGQITKHEGRLRCELDANKVSRKLLQTDITNSTIDQSLLGEPGDISVLTNKQAFIK